MSLGFFAAVQEFLSDLPGDFKLAKSAFIAALVTECKDKAFPEATHCIDEAETLLHENEGVIVVGVFPTGGHLGSGLPCWLYVGAGGGCARVCMLC